MHVFEVTVFRVEGPWVRYIEVSMAAAHGQSYLTQARIMRCRITVSQAFAVCTRQIRRGGNSARRSSLKIPTAKSATFSGRDDLVRVRRDLELTLARQWWMRYHLSDVQSVAMPPGFVADAENDGCGAVGGVE